ncbi:MAG: Ig domain-containing protein [Prosthecobacter sp.]|nr:Ig domain-containing protein [Prosthecobacter sp.]
MASLFGSYKGRFGAALAWLRAFAPERLGAMRLGVPVLIAAGLFAVPIVGRAACPTITVGPSTLPTAIVGSAYSQTLTASGGDSPYTFSVSSGSLPTGLSLNATTGVISGTATSAGSSTFTIRARDEDSCSGTRSYTLTRSCPTITISPTSLANGTINLGYSQTITATGNSSLTFSVSSGTLPSGLALNGTSGVISGTPTTSYPNGTPISIRATSPYSCTSTRNYSLRICPTITLGSLVNGTVGSTYSDSVAASGGDSPYVYSVVVGSLPPGLSLSSSTGAITGKPTSSASTTYDSGGGRRHLHWHALIYGRSSVPDHDLVADQPCQWATGDWVFTDVDGDWRHHAAYV